jgi:hypothetical protein
MRAYSVCREILGFRYGWRATKAHELEQLLPWSWKVERLAVIDA